MNTISSITGNTNTSISKFSSNRYIAGGQEFLDSNSIVAKFAFLIVVLMLFVVLLRLGSSLLTWFLTPSTDPVLINGMINARQMVVIPQDPSVKGAIPIVRSVNDATGIEFTWSVWMYIDDFSYKQNECIP